MFDTLIALFERLVVAHEKLAASQEAILRVTDVRIVEDPKPEDAKAEPKTKTTKTKAEKKAEPKPVEKPEPTLVDVKKAVAGYAALRLEGGSATPKDDARALMAHHGAGATKTDDIPEDNWQDVIDACTGGWEPIPAKEEEL